VVCTKALDQFLSIGLCELVERQSAFLRIGSKIRKQMGVTLQEARQALDNFEAVTSHEGNELH
jgi:hypothetical protein